MTESSNAQPIPVMEFEGAFVRQMEGTLPAITLDMPEGYVRGTHMKLEVEVRVRNVRFDEDKNGDLIRKHTLALEEVKLTDAFDPATRSNNVGGNSAGDAWVDILVDYLNEESEELDFDGEEIPDRLREILEALYTKQAQTSLAVESLPAPGPPTSETLPQFSGVGF